LVFLVRTGQVEFSHLDCVATALHAGQWAMATFFTSALIQIVEKK
jgi:hypothetical protein